MALGVVCMMKVREEDRAATSSLLGHASCHAKSPGVAEPVSPFNFSFVFQGAILEEKTTRRIRARMRVPPIFMVIRIYACNRYHLLSPHIWLISQRSNEPAKDTVGMTRVEEQDPSCIA